MESPARSNIDDILSTLNETITLAEDTARSAPSTNTTIEYFGMRHTLHEDSTPFLIQHIESEKLSTSSAYGSAQSPIRRNSLLRKGSASNLLESEEESNFGPYKTMTLGKILALFYLRI
jgi:hypothetical protein